MLTTCCLLRLCFPALFPITPEPSHQATESSGVQAGNSLSLPAIRLKKGARIRFYLDLSSGVLVLDSEAGTGRSPFSSSAFQ
jgi:hypothetical protein